MVKKFKIVSLEQTSESMLGFVEKKYSYSFFSLSKDGSLTYLKSYDKSEYKDYEHFVGVIGKFNPYRLFFKKPKYTSTMTYAALEKLSAA